MRQSMTIRIEKDVLDVAKVRAKAENRTLTNYIETLVLKDIVSNPVAIELDDRVTVFLAESVKERPVTDPREGDTAADVERRQEYLDIITGWGRNA